MSEPKLSKRVQVSVPLQSVADLDEQIRELQRQRSELMMQVPSRAETYRAYKEQLVQLQSVLRRYDVTLPESRLTMQAGWRALVPELHGHIDGCPTLVGKLICTNGVMAIMILPLNKWADVHIRHFIPVDNQDLEQLHGITKSRSHKPVKTQEELVKYLLDIG